MSDEAWIENGLLAGKRIVITGCSSGIGLETARLAKKLGAEVIGIDINITEDHVDELYIADLSSRDAIDQLVAALPGGIDGLANIAGLPPTMAADKVLLVNLVGLKYLTSSLVSKMSDGASIVNLASLAGLGWQKSIESIKASESLDFDGVGDFIDKHQVGSEGGRSYFFSKEAVIAWTMQNRWTWRERNIRMNAVSPGPVDTPILKDFLETLGDRAKEDAKVMDRPGVPEDIAPVVCFMLSDMTHWIRGTNIPTDGGMLSNVLCEMNNL